MEDKEPKVYDVLEEVRHLLEPPTRQVLWSETVSNDRPCPVCECLVMVREAIIQGGYGFVEITCLECGRLIAGVNDDGGA
ncbi:MAG: hypothetical protein ACWGQW_00570 [bacterium]